MGNYSLTTSSGANNDATMNKGDDDVDGNNGPCNNVGGHVCWEGTGGTDRTAIALHDRINVGMPFNGWGYLGVQVLYSSPRAWTRQLPRCRITERS
jgi:hypothetical protein